MRSPAKWMTLRWSRLAWMAVLSAAAAIGQTTASRGEAIFAQTCGSGYCHGARGAGAGAPRLAARGFTQEFIRTTVSQGVKGTSMPAFAPSLPAAELNAVIAYVGGLNGLSAATSASVKANGPKLTASQVHGRDLFRDPVRGFGRCSTCHLAGGMGLAVAAPMSVVPANALALRNLRTQRVITVTVAGASMPALIVAKKASEVKFYDLTVPPPVLRTVAPAEFTIAEGSTWKHSSVISKYTDGELTAILAYLRTVVR